MGSGAIYAVIVALWALVLIPLWLRNHDRSGEARQIDRYRSALSTLSPAEQSHGREERQVSARASSDDDDWHEQTPAELAAARRRLVLAVLAGLVAGALILVLLGVAPLWFPLLPAALLGGFGVVSRRQAALAEERERRERRAEAPRQREAERQERRQAPQRRYSAAPATAGADLPEARRTERDAVTSGWEPVSAPLPTYVSAPRASRVPRVIDLTHTGEWDGQAMVDEARRTLDGAARGDRAMQELDRAIDDDAFFDQLAGETRGPRAVDFFDQEAPRAVND